MGAGDYINFDEFWPDDVVQAKAKKFTEFEDMPKTCKFCGESHLHWMPYKGGWRLFNEDGVLHECR